MVVRPPPPPPPVCSRPHPAPRLSLLPADIVTEMLCTPFVQSMWKTPSLLNSTVAWASSFLSPSVFAFLKFSCHAGRVISGKGNSDYSLLKTLQPSPVPTAQANSPAPWHSRPPSPGPCALSTPVTVLPCITVPVWWCPGPVGPLSLPHRFTVSALPGCLSSFLGLTHFDHPRPRLPLPAAFSGSWLGSGPLPCPPTAPCLFLRQ